MGQMVQQHRLRQQVRRWPFSTPGTLPPHLIGEGSCDPFRSLAEFDRLGYTGWIILENYFWRVPLCQRGDDPYALLRRDLDTVRTWLAAHA